MTLPTIIDIAIGLIFIYLILSLLTSEIQELIATLLQWRAIHLKRSIEILLTGGEGVSVGQARVVEGLVSDLYNNPLIKNLNQEAKNGIEARLGTFTSRLTDLGCVSSFDIEKFMNLQLEDIKKAIPDNQPSCTDLRTTFTELEKKLKNDAKEYKHKKYTQVSSLNTAMEEINSFLHGSREDINKFIESESFNKCFPNSEDRKIIVNKIKSIDILKHKDYLDFVDQVVDNDKYKFTEKRRSAPSYIPAETFSTTLLVKLKIPSVIQKLNWLNLKKFVNNEIIFKIKELIEATYEKKVLTDLKYNLGFNGDHGESLISRANNILENFKNGKISLSTSLALIKEEIELFIENCQKCFYDQQGQLDVNNYIKFANQIRLIKKDAFINNNDQELVEYLQSNLTEAIGIIQSDSEISIRFWNEIEKVRATPESTTYKALNEAYEDIHEEIKRLEKLLPIGLRETLYALTVRTKIKAENVDKEVDQFKKEIETWFDRSMDRASGVYKRNAKGVAFVIGLIVAAIANADTFHMVSKLSRNESLRKEIVTNANLAIQNQNSSVQTNANESPTDNLKQINEGVSRSLANIPSLPIGWTESNRCEQFGRDFIDCPKPETPLQRQQKKQPQSRFTLKSLFNWCRFFLIRIPGWTLSGLAFAMGAPFWFDILSTFINVRNTGPKPKSTTDK